LLVKIKKGDKMTTNIVMRKSVLGPTASAFLKLVFVAMLISVAIFKLSSTVSVGDGYEKKQAEDAEAKVLLNACWQAMGRVEQNIGTITEQRADIKLLSEALNSGKVTSGQLWHEEGGSWLGMFRKRVDAREAMIGWARLGVLESKAAEPTQNLSITELEEAESLYMKISRQLDVEVAWIEGLRINHGDLWRTMYHIRHRGENPP
jgi:hypothetical protein